MFRIGVLFIVHSWK